MKLRYWWPRDVGLWLYNTAGIMVGAAFLALPVALILFIVGLAVSFALLGLGLESAADTVARVFLAGLPVSWFIICLLAQAEHSISEFNTELNIYMGIPKRLPELLKGVAKLPYRKGETIRAIFQYYIDKAMVESAKELEEGDERRATLSGALAGEKDWLTRLPDRLRAMAEEED